jgi:hypothetical protein
MSRTADAAARDPFRPRAASSSPFPSAAFERARADATASLARGVMRIAVVGPAGVGKSALLAQIARDVAPAGEIAWLKPPATVAPDAPTLLVDEIDRLDATTRASLRARAHGTRLIVAGLCDPDRTDDTVQVALTPLEADETGPYVQHRLRAADLPLDLFDEAAIARLGTAAARVPRVLDALAGRALFAASLDEADKVTEIHARQAIEEHAALLAADPERNEAVAPPEPAPPAPIEHAATERAAAATVAAKPVAAEHPAAVPAAAEPARAAPAPLPEPVQADPAMLQAALAFAASTASNEEADEPPRLRQPSPPLVAQRVWPDFGPPPERRVGAPMLVMVAAVSFIVGAVLVLAARASDANEPQIASTVTPTEADAARTQTEAAPQAQPAVPQASPQAAMPASLPVPPAAAPLGGSGTSSVPASEPAGAPRVFVHFRRDDPAGEQAAQAIAERLRARGFRIAELRPVDLRINQASVRYFFDGDRTRSQALEREVDTFVREAGLAPRSELLPMRYYEPKPRPGTLEVWLPSR